MAVKWVQFPRQHAWAIPWRRRCSNQVRFVGLHDTQLQVPSQKYPSCKNRCVYILPDPVPRAQGSSDQCDFWCAEHPALVSLGSAPHTHLCGTHRPRGGGWHLARAARRMQELDDQGEDSEAERYAETISSHPCWLHPPHDALPRRSDHLGFSLTMCP